MPAAPNASASGERHRTAQGIEAGGRDASVARFTRARSASSGCAIQQPGKSRFCRRSKAYSTIGRRAVQHPNGLNPAFGCYSIAMVGGEGLIFPSRPNRAGHVDGRDGENSQTPRARAIDCQTSIRQRANPSQLQGKVGESFVGLSTNNSLESDASRPVVVDSLPDERRSTGCASAGILTFDKRYPGLLARAGSPRCLRSHRSAYLHSMPADTSTSSWLPFLYEAVWFSISNYRATR
jgi:hypothetical protein